MFEFERTVGTIPLREAWQKVSAKNSAAGIDNIDVAFYRENETENLERLHCSLVSLQYVPCTEVTRVIKTLDRQIFISSLEDKIVQTAAAQVIAENAGAAESVHGYVKERSIFTAQKRLKAAIKKNIVEYYKTDIHKFYESIDQRLLLKKLRTITADKKFLALIKLLLTNHKTGISTGSCLSPVLSNLYLADLDTTLEKNSEFYSRYVDDILIAPQAGVKMQIVIDQTNDALNNLKLKINPKKSLIVNANNGFRYLGFDIGKNNVIDTLIQEENYVLAEQILNQKQPERNEETHDYEKYSQLFIRDTRHHYLSTDAADRYKKISQPLDNTGINYLVNGKREFAVPAVDASKLCSFAVFDIDINREYILKNGDGGEIFSKLLTKTNLLANTIKKRLQEMDINSYIEFSGYKGYHVWVFWQNPISQKKQKAFFNDALWGLEVPPGINVEKFPLLINDNPKIKLPLSYHLISGQQAMFLTDGESQLQYIAKIKRSVYQPQQQEQPAPAAVPVSEYTPPAYIAAIYQKCHVVKKIADKADRENYIGYHERISLLYIFHCLKEAGAKYLHHVMGKCINYDYLTTQKHIDNCKCMTPIGCKKLSERFEDVWGKSECKCSFSDADMYPSPVIHARLVKPDCFAPPAKEDRLGHFKQAPVKEKAETALTKLIELNKKEYEIHSQQKIFYSQIENLFQRNGLTEIQTPQGLLIKNEAGLFIKVG